MMIFIFITTYFHTCIILITIPLTIDLHFIFNLTLFADHFTIFHYRNHSTYITYHLLAQYLFDFTIIYLLLPGEFVHFYLCLLRRVQCLNRPDSLIQSPTHFLHVSESILFHHKYHKQCHHHSHLHSRL